jgi:hypothetical protein
VSENMLLLCFSDYMSGIVCCLFWLCCLLSKLLCFCCRFAFLNGWSVGAWLLLNGTPVRATEISMDIAGIASRTVLTYRHHHTAESDSVKRHIRINKETQGMHNS